MLELKGKFCKDCKIFTDNIEEEALSTIHKILNQPISEGTKMRIMPDVHQGRGDSVIGFTMPLNNYVNVDTVGCDIGCTVSCYILNKKIDPKDYELIEHRIRKEIPFGFEINKERQFDMKEFLKFVQNFYNKARSAWPEMILDFDISEKGISKMLKRLKMDEGTFWKSISSIGSGNHYCELGDLNNQEISAFSVHCGSRNFGQKVYQYWNNVSTEPEEKKVAFKISLQAIKKTCKNKRELPQLIQELRDRLDNDIRFCAGYLRGDDMKGYITDMVIATAYAQFNHLIISRKIEGILYHTCQAKVTEKICSIHNYIDFQDHIIRKGAIRAYEGEKMVIPFNMRDGLAICEGKSNEDWNYSACHGAGRLLSRSAAKKRLNLDSFKEQMKDIYSTSVNASTLDEAPDAYKPYQEIVDLIQPTAEILYFIRPVINLKANG